MTRYAHAITATCAMEIIEKEIGLNGAGKTTLKQIFEDVRAGKMNFEEFSKKVKLF